MKSIFLAAAACLLLNTSSFAMSDADCMSLWRIADTNSDGSLTGAEGDRYLAMLRIANQTVGIDGTITEPQFQESCKSDIFTVAAAEPGAPFPGANSFTESQAKDRVVANGMELPELMKLDESGIWRGTTKKDGKPVNVAVDFKGNVIAQ